MCYSIDYKNNTKKQTGNYDVLLVLVYNRTSTTLKLQNRVIFKLSVTKIILSRTGQKVSC